MKTLELFTNIIAAINTPACDKDRVLEQIASDLLLEISKSANAKSGASTKSLLKYHQQIIKSVDDSRRVLKTSPVIKFSDGIERQVSCDGFRIFRTAAKFELPAPDKNDKYLDVEAIIPKLSDLYELPFPMPTPEILKAFIAYCKANKIDGKYGNNAFVIGLGDVESIAVNPKYLLEALESCADQKWYYSSSVKPLYFVSESDNCDGLLLPIRIVGDSTCLDINKKFNAMLKRALSGERVEIELSPKALERIAQSQFIK